MRRSTSLVDRYNTALVQYAHDQEAAADRLQQGDARAPAVLRSGRDGSSSDGVHYTHGTTQFPATSDPYANGGDPATHTTGLALTYNGYGLKGWLGVQKMKEIKQLVIDGVTPAPLPAPTDTTPPTVTSMTPASGATGVATSASVSATFSEAMTATSVTTTTFSCATRRTRSWPRRSATTRPRASRR